MKAALYRKILSLPSCTRSCPVIQMIRNPEPAPPSRESAPIILRDNVVRTIEDMLISAGQVVVVSGPTGMGKTTLLRQFADANASRTLALFVTGTSSWAYDASDLAGRLVEQTARLLGIPAEVEENPVFQLQRLYPKLRRAADAGVQPYYFILDGLEDIPIEADAARRAVLALLPIGMSDRFRFVLSAETGARELPLNPTVLDRCRDLVVPGFDKGDIKDYLSALGLHDNELIEVVRVTRGTPQKVVTVRRLLCDSLDPHALVWNLPTEAPELFRMQWSGLNLTEQSDALPLAVLAFDELARTAADLADLAGTDEATVDSLLRRAPFVRSDAQQAWQYVSASDQRFAREHLKEWEVAVHDAFIERLKRTPDSAESMSNLPAHLIAAGRTDEVISYLNASRFARLYETAPSLAVVRRRADDGINAAESLKRDPDLLRFVLQKATVQEIAGSAAAESEVRALSAVGDIDNALAVAEQASRLEAKFRLLAAVVRARREAGLPEDVGLRTRLKDLLAQIDPEDFGEDQVAVAIDLLATAPDLAVELVSRGVQRGENSMDWSLALLVVHGEAQAKENGEQTGNSIEQIRQRIQDPAAQRLSVAATMLFGSISADEALQRAEALETTSDRLFLLQHWIAANRTSEQAARVLERGLETALQARNYKVNAATFRQLAVCLPYLKSRQEADYYVSRFDALRAAIEEQGPPEEFFRLLLILARTQWKWDSTVAHDRFLGIYNETAKLSDPMIRTTVLARISAALTRLDPDRLVDADLHAVVDAEVEAGIETLFQISAEHDEVLRGVVRALAVTRPERVLEIIPGINTEWRRDESLRDFIEAIMEAPTDEIPVEAVLKALDGMSAAGIRDSAVEQFLTVLSNRQLSEADVTRLEPMIRRAAQVGIAMNRLHVSARLAGVLALVEGASARALSDEMMAAAEDSYNLLGEGWRTVNAVADAVAVLARGRPDDAREYLRRFRELKNGLACPDYETALAGRLGLLLAIRAYTGLVHHKLISPEMHQERLLRAIERCGAAEEQGSLLASLCIRYWLIGESARAGVVAERLLKSIDQIPAGDRGHRQRMIAAVWPALHVGAPSTAATLLEVLDPLEREGALSEAAWMLLRKVPPGDAYRSERKSQYKLTGEELLGVVRLMRQIDSDPEFYSILCEVVDAAEPSQRRELITRAVRGDLVRVLDELVAEKFPNQRFIQHEGYRIASEVQINRLREGSTRRSAEQFVKRAMGIPNLSDRAYVLSIIGSTVGPQHERDKIMLKAEAEIGALPMLRDRIDRLGHAASLLLDRDSHRAKQYVKESTTLLRSGAGDSLHARRRSLIDLAYRIDSEFAASIASMFDDDPAKQRVERQVRRKDLVRSINHGGAAKDVAGNPRDFSDACWVKLGDLQAGATATTQPRELLPLLRHAAVQSISAGYPIVAYFIENAIRRMQHHASEVRAYVAPLYEAVLNGAELALHRPGLPRRTGASTEITDLTEGVRETVQQTESTGVRPTDLGPKPPPVEEDSNSSVQIAPAAPIGLIATGHRADALEMLRAWLRYQPSRELFIFEPYFYPTNVDLLKLIREADERWTVRLVSGPESIAKLKAPYRQHYREAWRAITSDDLPDTFLTFVTRVSDGKCPVHDRWWFTDDSGLNLGTSFNGLGARLSTIRTMLPEEVQALRAELSPYFAQQRTVDGERMDYEAFSI